MRTKGLKSCLTLATAIIDSEIICRVSSEESHLTFQRVFRVNSWVGSIKINTEELQRIKKGGSGCFFLENPQHL
jgi:hypothetical protein